MSQTATNQTLDKGNPVSNGMNKALPAMNRLFGFSDKVLLAINGIAVVTLTLIIFFDVVLRFLFNMPIPATKEISELLMPYIAFTALSYTLYCGMHIRITLLTTKFGNSPRIKQFLEIINNVCGALFCFFLTYYAWHFFWDSFAIREEVLAVIKLPWYVGKFSFFLGYLFFTVRYLLELLKVVFEKTAFEENTA